jgi:predicted phage baseplate assembly protein
MPLPNPTLDDRRFQDLVDEAKRMVQARCPEWSDHNVSDPGVTLIETFAYMVDQLLYRLNRVPNRQYLKFLDLIGLQPFPPTAARADVTFWLSAPREEMVLVPEGTQLATVRGEVEEPVVFQTTKDISILPCQLERVLVAPGGVDPVDRTDELFSGDWIQCFADQPAPGDAVLFGLSDPVPSCAVLLRLECAVAGRGVDPRDPPLIWEAWTDSGWAPCQVDRDTTGALNRAGEVVLHLPAGHTASVVGRRRAGWVRCVAITAAPGQPFYGASPRMQAASAATIGATGPAVHAELISDEVLGLAEGVPGGAFPVHRPPIAAGEPLEVQVADGSGWNAWREVPDFGDSAPEDRHFVADRGTGEITFGPAIRQPDGTVRQYGAVPPKGAVVKIVSYRTGGGRRGNVARNSLIVLRDSVPFVSAVTNRVPATGGVDGESVTEAAARGPLQLRTRERAVTAADYEHLARQAAPEAVRVRCVPVGPDSPAVRLLVVPAVGDMDPSVEDATRFADLQPPAEMLERIRSYLDERRCVGARVLVEPPLYQGLTVVAKLRARPRVSPDVVREQAMVALYGYLNPVRGGPDGDGWPFGRRIQSGEVHSVLQQLPGVDFVEDVLLFAANPRTGERGSPVQRVDLSDNALVFSYGHQVRVV